MQHETTTLAELLNLLTVAIPSATNLQLCRELNKQKLYRRFGREAIIFYEHLWREKVEEMDTRRTKTFLREIKDLASSVEDYERERHYQDVYQVSC